MVQNNIKKLRTEKHLRLEDLANKVGLSASTISNYESGTRQPDNDKLLKIASALDTTGLSTSLYELRHTMISVCKSQVPTALLKQAVGHSMSMDTYGTYAHEMDGELQVTADLIDQAFLRAMGYNMG